MPKFFTFALIILVSFYSILWAFFAFNWQRTKYVLSSDIGIVVWGIIILFPILIAIIFYQGIVVKNRLSIWKNAGNEFGLKQKPNRFFLEGDFKDFKLEVAADAKRKFAVQGAPAYKFSTIAGAKFSKPFPKEFKITNLNFESTKVSHPFTNNSNLTNALTELKNQNYDFFFFSNEGIFIQNEGIVGDEKTIKQMILSVKKLCDAIYKSSA